MSKQKIVSIEIELKNYEPIRFTMDEAKELHEQLDTLFGKKEVHHIHRDPWWTRPYYTWTTSTGVSPQNITKWNGLTNGSVLSNSTGMKVSYLSAP